MINLRVLSALSALSFCFVTAPAAAVTQVNASLTVKSTDIGYRIRVGYNGFVNETLISGLVAHTIFTLSSVSANNRDWKFAITQVANQSLAPITASRVSIFGFDVDKTLSSASASDTIFSRVSLNGNVPQIGPRLDVCFRAGGGGGGCASGGGGGVLLGQASAPGGSFTLRFAAAVTDLKMNNFFVRYQSIAGTNAGSSGVGVATYADFAAPFPEPGIWVQMITGFGLVGVAVRRRRAGVSLA